jgi:hypothetical protein
MVIHGRQGQPQVIENMLGLVGPKDVLLEGTRASIDFGQTRKSRRCGSGVPIDDGATVEGIPEQQLRA